MVIPASPLFLLQDVGPLDIDSSEASQAKGPGHVLGSPCSSQPTDHPSPEGGNAPVGWRREEQRAAQSQHLWVRRATPGAPRLLRCIPGAPHSSRSLLCPFRSRVLTLGDNMPAGMVHELCWRRIWESLLLLISSEGAQVHRSRDHTAAQGALQWPQNLLTFSEISAKLTVPLGVDRL